MPTVEKTIGGRVNVRGIGEFVSGDRAEVSTADAQYLVEERGDFELVDDGSEDQADDAEVDQEEAEDTDTDDSVADDVDVLIDEFDEDLWLDRDYRDRVDLVETGLFDEHLDTITEVETSSTVEETVDERRAELED